MLLLKYIYLVSRMKTFFFKWRWFINVCNKGRVASNLRQLAAHLPCTKGRCKSIRLAYETRDHALESQWLRISSLEEMWRKERTGISFTSVMFVNEVCKNELIHVDLLNVNTFSGLGNHYTFRKQWNQSIECPAVVSPTVQAQHGTAIRRTPNLTSHLSPWDSHSELRRCRSTEESEFKS